MMRPIPEDVRRFVGNYINSVEQLEVLLALQQSPHLDSDAEGLSRLLRSQPSAVQMRLRDLCSRGLVKTDEPANRFRYAPATPELGRLVVELAELYRTNPVSVIALIYSPTDNHRET